MQTSSVYFQNSSRFYKYVYQNHCCTAEIDPIGIATKLATLTWHKHVTAALLGLEASPPNPCTIRTLGEDTHTRSSTKKWEIVVYLSSRVCRCGIGDLSAVCHVLFLIRRRGALAPRPRVYLVVRQCFLLGHVIFYVLNAVFDGPASVCCPLSLPVFPSLCLSSPEKQAGRTQERRRQKKVQKKTRTFRTRCSLKIPWTTSGPPWTTRTRTLPRSSPTRGISFW